MGGSRTSGQAEQRAARIGVPMRCAKTGKGRDEVYTVCVWNACRQRLDLSRRFDDTQPVTQPLHDCTGNKHAAFQGIVCLLA